MVQAAHMHLQPPKCIRVTDWKELSGRTVKRSFLRYCHRVLFSHQKLEFGTHLQTWLNDR